MIRTAILMAIFALPVSAQDAAQAARDAARGIEAAIAQMDAANSARDRVRAMTETVRAFEDGLAALRAGLRGATVREAELTRALSARDAETAELLAALQIMERQNQPSISVHPEGPLATARAGMLVAALTPALHQRAADLRAELQEVTALRRAQEEARAQLQDGLEGIQKARADLSRATHDRTDLPRRFSADPVRTAILISASETLQQFAQGLSQISAQNIPPLEARIDDRKGTLRLPVTGQILRQANEPDAAGVARPGVVIAAQPQALVTTPVAATLRYRGPLLDYGQVAILEPQPDLLIVIAGLGTVYGEIGEILPEGDPVGLMGGEPANSTTIASQSSERGGVGLSETLYIEVRQGDTPVDPMNWFITNKG